MGVGSSWLRRLLWDGECCVSFKSEVKDGCLSKCVIDEVLRRAAWAESRRSALIGISVPFVVTYGRSEFFAPLIRY